MSLPTYGHTPCIIIVINVFPVITGTLHTGPDNSDKKHTWLTVFHVTSSGKEIQNKRTELHVCA